MVGEPPSASREPPYEQYHQDPMPTDTTSGLGSMEISWLLVKAISAASKHWNQMPLPYSPGMTIVCGSDVMTFLHKYESLTPFTSTDPTSSNAVRIFPYCCVEDSNGRDMVVILRGYVEEDWAALTMEMVHAFRLANSRFGHFIHTRRYLDVFCAEFGG